MESEVINNKMDINEIQINGFESLKTFFSKAELSKLLKSIDLCHHKITEITFRYPMPKDRYSLELETQVDLESPPYHMLIDYRLGQPTWEQFINITYDVDEYYDKRIIVFDGDYGKKDFSEPVGDALSIGSLVRMNNKCEVDTYLVRARGLVQHLQHGGRKHIRYILENGPCLYINGQTIMVLQDDERPQDLPTKRQVQEAEFWAGYFYSRWWRAKPIDFDKDIIGDWNLGYSMSSCMKIHSDWNDQGFFIDLVGDAGCDEIEWIWANRKSVFEEKYPGCPVSLKNADGLPKAISVKIYDISMTELIKMEPKDKWSYGLKVLSEELRLYQIALNIIEDYEIFTEHVQLTVAS